MPHFYRDATDGQTVTISDDQWAQLIELLTPMAQLAKAGLAQIARDEGPTEAPPAPPSPSAGDK